MDTNNYWVGIFSDGLCYSLKQAIFFERVCVILKYFFSVYQRFLLAIVFDLQCVNVHTV